MKLFYLASFCFAVVQAVAADALQSKTTYAKAYGETKNSVAIDPAKDLPRYPAIEPKDAIRTWQVKQGFKLELAAHEPQLRSPVAIAYDERGRMFVCEMIDYSEMRDVTPHLGRISMLEDKDGDGFYETSTVFADNLPWPTGLICANGGVYVVATPDVWFFKDTKGTGKADVREIVYTGFGTGLKLLNVQGMANCPQWGLDNRIHIQSGPGNKGLFKCLKRPDLKEIEISGHDVWFDPKTLEFGLEAGGGQYGMSFDNYGRRFVCSNSDHLQYYLYDEKYAHRNPFFTMPAPRQSIAADGGAAEVYRISPDEPWRIIRTRWRIAGVVKGMVEGGGRVSGYFTGATGTTIYRGDAYGDDFVNNSFTGDAGGQLVHRKKIRFADDGVNLVGERPADEQKFEFAASKDTWVRVVNFANAPDGCLNIIDMYREVIEHPWSIPDEIKKYIDLNSGNDRGRIYRIVPENFTNRRSTKVNLADATTEELVKTLGHSNGWHRDTAARLLYERQDKSAVALLAKLMTGDNALAKIHALGALEGLGGLDEAAVLAALADSNEHVRERGLVAAEHLVASQKVVGEGWSEKLPAALASMVADPSTRVRFQLVFTIEACVQPSYAMNSDPNKVHTILMPAWAKLVAQDYQNPWIGSAITGVFWALGYQTFGDFRSSPALNAPQAVPFLAKLIELSATTSGPGIHTHLIAVIEKHSAKAALLRAFMAGLKKSNFKMAEVDPDNRLVSIFKEAVALASNSKSPEGVRLGAIDLIGLIATKEASEALTQCLASGQPDAVQAAAVTTLAAQASKDVAPTLISNWSHFSTKGKEASLAALTARDDRALSLLKAVEAGTIKPTDFTASQVQGLLHSKDAKVVAAAKTALVSVIPPSREEVVAKFKDAAATKGDAQKGQAQYIARCVACHRAGGTGIQVGPDLVTVKTKGREGILSAILEPSKEVAAQYIAYTVNAKDGQIFNGIIVHDDASSLTLKLMGGVEQTVQRSNIKGTTSTGSSLMPDGLETGMSVQDMADLLSFIEATN